MAKSSNRQKTKDKEALLQEVLSSKIGTLMGRGFF